MPSATRPLKRCLVTGCAGNVGSKLTQTLLDMGHAVVGVDSFFSGLPANMEPFKDHALFRFERRSITEPELIASLGAVSGRFACVFHLAAIVSVPWSMEHPEETMAVNWDATRALHREARELGIPAFVFAGSAAEYGRPIAGAVQEDQASDPQSPYGWSKYVSSRHIEESGYGCSLRFFNLYGPARGKPGPYDGVVRRFMALALDNAPLTIHGQGQQTRDFVYVHDAVKAVVTASGLGNGGVGLQGVYNVGTGSSTTIRGLADLTIALSGADCGVCLQPKRDGDIEHSLANTDKFHAATGFRPSTPLSQGLGQTLDWFRQHRSEIA
ncbi:NAD-dependent epimerase/dehydratase family protein [Desulfovibrio sp. DV]|uniref:NAD-dependent epimerase/dehydratase family protein n=1 Tax=Desulfovibrio sp. DV TaxID=1844708 RepID=UPI00094B7916|nr:NAD-dependent epimerase/dehydratase family protein [Desulfovibrio sp. DV]